MKWNKKGVIFMADGQSETMVSHTQIPTAILLDDVIRIYFASRTSEGKSLPYYIDVNPDNPPEILHIQKTPVLDFGAKGEFDADGVMPASVVNRGEKLLLYYTGWSTEKHQPYALAIGLAESVDGGKTFKKNPGNPIIPAEKPEHFLAASPGVIYENGVYHMWYSSGVKWLEASAKKESVYLLRHAVSADGVVWKKDAGFAIPVKQKDESQGCPAIIKKDGVYRMWFCYRGATDFRDGAGSYRIGYAESPDLLDWRRMDEKSGLEFSTAGFDAKMQAYPSIVEVAGRYYLFYNGDGFGKSGIGYAVCEK